MKDNWNAFVNDQINLQTKDSGQLNGLTFAVKDVYGIKDYTESCGESGLVSNTSLC